MTKKGMRTMKVKDVPVQTFHDADELVAFMASSGGYIYDGRGLQYVGASTDYYAKPAVDASLVYDVSKNNYITEHVQRLKSLLFITPPTIEVFDENEVEDEMLSAEVTAIWDSPDVDGWTKVQQAWVDMFTWGCALFNPVWMREGSEIRLVKLRRLPPESFGNPPKVGAKRRIYSHILKGITLDDAGELECWQTQNDDEPHLIKNVQLVKDPTASALAGESSIVPITPIVRALDFAWVAQRQKVARIGAPTIFIRFTGPPVKTTDRDDIAHVKKILQNWGKGTAFMLRDNMEVVRLEFVDNQSAIQTIETLERRLRSYFSPATLIQGEGSTISESGGAKVDMVTEWIRGQHNMMEGIFEGMLQEFLAQNAYEGYLVRITIPEPSPDRNLTMAQAKVGFETQSLTTNEIREKLGEDALDDDALEELKAEYEARRPPPSPFGSPFGAPPTRPPPGGEATFIAHAIAVSQTDKWEAAGFPHPDAGLVTHPQGEWQAPEAGEGAPKGLKAILRSAYSSCRDAWAKKHPDDIENKGSKESCARIAWSAAKKAGWRKSGGRWVKHLADTDTEEYADELEYELVQADRELTDRLVRALKGEPLR